MMLYLGSDNKLPLVDYDENVEKPIIVTTLTNEDEIPIRKKINKKYIYYICAYEGCACGFSYDKAEIEDEYDESGFKKSKESVLELFLYLGKNIKDDFLLFSCWAGDEDKDAEIERTINLNKLQLDDEFSFNERELIRIIKE